MTRSPAYTLTLILPIILAASTIVQKHAAKPPFALALSAEKTAATLGSDIRVKVRWTNTSDEAGGPSFLRLLQKGWGLSLSAILSGTEESPPEALPVPFWNSLTNLLTSCYSHSKILHE